MKLLLRFFLNHNLSGYLQGLSKELDENTNSIRVELNRLEQAGILSSELEGRRKLYRVNEQHPLTENLTAIVRKVTGIEYLVDRVVRRVGDNLQQVWITGELSMGIESDILEVVLVGSGLNQVYIKNLIRKVEKHLAKKINYSIVDSFDSIQETQGFQIWDVNIEI